MVGAVENYVLHPIGEDRLVVIAVRRRHVTTTGSRLKIVLAHQALDLLMINDDALLPKGGLNTPPAVAFELVADDRNGLDDRSVVGRRDCRS